MVLPTGLYSDSIQAPLRIGAMMMPLARLHSGFTQPPSKIGSTKGLKLGSIQGLTGE